jgi:hypothetical protein
MMIIGIGMPNSQSRMKPIASSRVLCLGSEQIPYAFHPGANCQRIFMPAGFEGSGLGLDCAAAIAGRVDVPTHNALTSDSLALSVSREVA